MLASGTRTTTYALAAATLAVLAAGCGSSASSAGGTQSIAPAAGGGSASSAAAASSPASTGGGAASATSKHSTSIGTVLADAKGRTIYELVGDPASNSACTSSCESIWPPVMSGGKILVVHGHPAFTFTGDSKPGQANGEGSKDSWGLWLALKPNGSAIAAQTTAPTKAPATPPATPPSSASSSGGGGGYGY
jgi:predicted lipoprotein with Yx(FWY)xxD motif